MQIMVVLPYAAECATISKKSNDMPMDTLNGE
jgi:hypothetical protein